MLDRFSVWLFSNYSILIIAILIVGVFSVMLCYSRRLKISEILIIASLSGMSVASRIVILIPFFKPCTALIIIAGSAYGPAIGGMVGMLTGLLSNIVFGQGPWTPFQMFAWGLIGVISGIIKLRKKYIAIIYGTFITLILYGGVMNFYSMLTGGSVYNIYSFMAFVINGLPCDIIHSFGTLVFLYIGWEPFMKRMLRIKKKYGCFKGINDNHKAFCSVAGQGQNSKCID